MADIMTLEKMLKDGKYNADEQDVIKSAIQGMITEREMWAKLATKGAVTLRGVL